MGLWTQFTCCLVLAATGAFATYPPSPDGRGDESKQGSYLGIGVQEVDSARAKELGLKGDYGVEITRVVENGPAAKAGCKVGDVVVEFGGERLEGVDKFIRLVRDTPSGKSIGLELVRSGSRRRIVLTTGVRKTLPTRDPEWNSSSVESGEGGTWWGGILGVDAEKLDPQLAEYFGVKDGALVRSVLKSSPAERSGIRAGDVVVKIDDFKIASAKEITAALAASRAKKSVSVQVVREKRAHTVSVTIDD